MPEKKNENLAVSIGKAAVRGVAKGGGLIGSTAHAVQSGIGTVSNIKKGFQTYDKKQETIRKQQAAKSKPVAKPVSAKPMKTAPVSKPAPKPAVAKPTKTAAPKPAQPKKPVVKKK